MKKIVIDEKKLVAFRKRRLEEKIVSLIEKAEARERLKEKLKTENKDDIFYSYLKKPLVPVGFRKKFNFLYNNAGNYIKNSRFKFSKFTSKNNLKVIEIIYNGYILLLLGILYMFEYFEKNNNNSYRQELYQYFLDKETTYFFFKIFFEQYFFKNEKFIELLDCYMCDNLYKDVLLNIFNIKCLNSLDYFFVVLNIDEIKYEHDKCLTPKEK
jgi:hypothetical protein